MALTAGTRLGHYDVTALIGEGGMGQVWQATDIQLNRQVALKILPDAFADDADRLARFQREAQVLASLNHPNIAAIHGIEQSDDTQALVLELVEGPTLADRIAKGPIPVDEALPIATQIAEALEAAHEAGVIHRDLKPANIKVRDDGTVKVLDFGLAKALDPAPEDDPAQSPTLTAVATQMGVILGTAAYMSPEQARGKPVDKRTDIWAFGCVLYEMLAGRPVFEGEDAASILALVLATEADWNALPADMPGDVRRLLRRCLTRDPRYRLRDIGDARTELSDLRSGAEEDAAATSAQPRPTPRWPTAAVGLVMLIIGAAGAGGWVWSVMRPADARVQRFDVTPRLADVYVGNNAAPHLALSPDGRQVAFIGSGTPRQLHLRTLDQLDTRTLPGLGNPRQPFFSPDGEWIGFIDGSALKKVNANGGPAVTLGRVDGTGLAGTTWTEDGTIIFAANLGRGLFSVPDDGGTPAPLTVPDEQQGEVSHGYPAILPGGESALFTIFSRGDALASAQIGVVDLRTGSYEIVLRGASQAQYLPSGHLVYGAGDELWAVAYDVSSRAVRGDPVPVLGNVVTTSSGGWNFSVATEDGSLAYIAGVSGVAQRRLVWVDREGREEPLAAEPRPYVHARISPDGARMALDVRDQENDIWLWTVATGADTRLTLDPAVDRQPIWSHDGRTIAFSSDRSSGSRLYRRPSDGSGAAEPLFERPFPAQPTSFSPDDTQLIFWESKPETGLDVLVVDLDDGQVTSLLETPADERNAELSPDGRWLAYQSNRSGRFEVYVQPFPQIDGGEWQISTDGGTRPMWSPDGDELFYIADPDHMMVVPVEPGSTFAHGTPRALFDGPSSQPLFSRTYDTLDGQRFLMIKEAGSDDGDTQSERIILVQNWFAELERLVPVD